MYWDPGKPPKELFGSGGNSVFMVQMDVEIECGYYYTLDVDAEGDEGATYTVSMTLGCTSCDGTAEKPCDVGPDNRPLPPRKAKAFGAGSH